MEEKTKKPEKAIPEPVGVAPGTDQQVLKQFGWKRLTIPVIIAVVVLIYAVYQIRQEGINPLTDIEWTGWVLGMIALGFACMFMRDFGYIWRMRILTDKKLSWKSAFQVTLLWEFSSAISPSVVGGSALAIFMLIKEKISAGRTTAIVFITIFLDELFYILILPISLLAVDQAQIFEPLEAGESILGTSLMVGFWIAYAVLVAYTTFLAFALFIRPDQTSRLLRRLFRTRLLRRWETGGAKTADELLISAREFRTKSFRYWLKAWFATCFAWFGRYLVVNCLLAAFVLGLGFSEHLISFARQAVMFVVMIVSPTPGSSGVAEEMFKLLLSDYSGLITVIVVLWRGITYYPYLFLGVPLLPIWYRRVLKKDPQP
jgi:uncharacterized protein (TIRG00374 family)